MKYFFGLLCLFAICLKGYAAQEKPVVAVFASWKFKDDSIQTLPWDRFSHLAIASVYPMPDGSLNTEHVDQFIDELVDSAHEKGKLVILSVGGAGEGSKAYIDIMQSAKTAERFVKNVHDYAVTHKLDGVDIDWEYWTYQNELNKGGNDPLESQYLVRLLQSLRAQLNQRFLLTVDIAAGEWLGAQYTKDIQQHVDYVNLMAFDFTGAWPSSKIEHHSNYETFLQAVKHTLDKGFDPQKILIGFPAYGIEFIGNKKKEIKHVSYRDIVDMVGQSLPALARGKFKNIYFENTALFEKKARYVSQNGLAGIFIFDIASDHPSPEFSLLESSRKHIKPLQSGKK